MLRFGITPTLASVFVSATPCSGAARWLPAIAVENALEIATVTTVIVKIEVSVFTVNSFQKSDKVDIDLFQLATIGHVADASEARLESRS